MRASDHGNFPIRERKCGEEQRKRFYGPDALEEQKKSLCGPDAFEEQKKGLHGPDELHELEMLLSKLVTQMPNPLSARDRLPGMQRSTGGSRSTGYWLPMLQSTVNCLNRSCPSVFANNDRMKIALTPHETSFCMLCAYFCLNPSVSLPLRTWQLIPRLCQFSSFSCWKPSLISKNYCIFTVSAR